MSFSPCTPCTAARTAVEAICIFALNDAAYSWALVQTRKAVQYEATKLREHDETRKRAASLFPLSLATTRIRPHINAGVRKLQRFTHTHTPSEAEEPLILPSVLLPCRWCVHPPGA